MMFVYTVYPLPAYESPQRIRRVESACATEPVRPVAGTWRKQFGNAVPPQRPYAPQRVRRDFAATAAGTSATAAAPPDTSARPRPPMTSEVSSMEIRNAQATVLEQRSSKLMDGAYIRKYVERLNLAREKTIRQNEAAARANASARTHGAAKSALLEV